MAGRRWTRTWVGWLAGSRAEDTSRLLEVALVDVEGTDFGVQRGGRHTKTGGGATLSGALARHEQLLGRKAHCRSLGCARDDKSKRGASREGLLLE
jgi:hypothetical protein